MTQILPFPSAPLKICDLFDMACKSYPEVIIAIGIVIKAQMKIKSCIIGFKNEKGNAWVKDTTIENFALAKLIFDLALISS